MTIINRGRRSAALFLLCLANLMCILDISIVNIAIPSIQTELAMPTPSLQWIVTAYVLTYGGFLLVSGRLGDLYGRRRVLLLGLAFFTIASAIGGVSTNAATLLSARALQGLGGAIITPAVMSFISGLFPEGYQRNRALGILGTISGLGFALGLVLGGLLTNTVGWRWVFFINLPIGVSVVLMALWLLPETQRARQPVDIPGAALATAGLVLLTYALDGTDRFGLFSIQTLSVLAGAVAFFVIFVVVERRTDHPLVPHGLLQHRSLARAVMSSTIFGIVTGPTTFILTLYLQNVTRLDPLKTGLAFLPQEVTVFLAANFGGSYVTRYGSRAVLACGMIAFATGCIWLSQLSPTGGYVQVVVPGLLFVGLGIGSVVVAGSISATEGIEPIQHGVAAGVWNTGTQIGTALGLALLSAVAGAKTNALLTAVPDLDSIVATVHGYRLAFAVAAGFAVAGLLGLLLLGEPVVDRGREDTLRGRVQLK